MKIILDTNIYISSLLFGGNSKKVFDICFLQHEVIISAFILEEIRRVLVSKFSESITETIQLSDLLKNQAILIEPLGLKPALCRDPDDDHILWLAKSAKADMIITGDKDLLVLKKYEQTSIIHPKDYLSSLNLI